MTESMLELTLRQIQASLHDLTNEMAEVKVALGCLTERVGAMEIRMSHMEDRFEVRFANMEGRILRLERHLGVKS